jgi:hypothetical protein
MFLEEIIRGIEKGVYLRSAVDKYSVAKSAVNVTVTAKSYKRWPKQCFQSTVRKD